MRLFAALVFAGVAMLASAAKDPLECEVCLKAMSDITSPLSAADKKDLLKIEASVDKYCAKPSTEKENKLVCNDCFTFILLLREKPLIRDES
jgi:hypothetical protein